MARQSKTLNKSSNTIFIISRTRALHSTQRSCSKRSRRSCWVAEEDRVRSVWPRLQSVDRVNQSQTEVCATYKSEVEIMKLLTQTIALTMALTITAGTFAQPP